MNGRWIIRIAGLIMLMMLLGLLFNLENQLVKMQRARGALPASTR